MRDPAWFAQQYALLDALKALSMYYTHTRNIRELERVHRARVLLSWRML